MPLDLRAAIGQSARKRKHLLKVTNAMRLVNGLSDGLEGLFIDQYDRHFAIHVLHARWLGRAGEIVDLLQQEYAARYCIMKDRSRSAGSSRENFDVKVFCNGEQSATIVEEYGLKFNVDLNDGLNAGLFLDMRQVRNRVANLSKGKHVLNCFAYTCSFGVHCKAHGAASVRNVDISNSCLKRGMENYKLNGLSEGEHEFVRADTLFYLERAAAKGVYFDIIVVDPPSFSRHGKLTFSIRRDLSRLTKLALGALAPGGRLLLATNCSDLGHEDLVRCVREHGKGNRQFSMVLPEPGIDFSVSAGSSSFRAILYS